jgi:hypothetical protein
MKPVPRILPLIVGVAVALSCEVQQPTSPPALSLGKSMDGGASQNKCRTDRDHDSRSAPVEILCAVTVPGNPLVSVAKSWTNTLTNDYYLDDQSNAALDIIDGRKFEFSARVGGFVGAATGASGGTITYGGGTATSNGQGPNSMVPARHGLQLWVSDGNSTVRVVNVVSHNPHIVASISTAIPDCDGGTATTHFCGRVNEMTYDPDDGIILVENPNPLSLAYCTTHTTCATAAAVSYPDVRTLPPYATFISAYPPYRILGRVSFPDTKGTTEAPVWDHRIHRFLLPVPTCSGTAAPTGPCGATGATQEIAVINPHTRTITNVYHLPDCATLMPGITPGTGMLNDLSINERDQRVQMPVCGKGEVIFDARTGAVVNVVTQVGASDETWYNPGDNRFYVVSGVPGGAVPGGANTTSLGVIDGTSGLWLQNVLDVGGKVPTALATSNRIFTGVTVPAAGVAGNDSTACAQFGFTGTGCVTVFEHEGGESHGHGGWH